MSKFRICMTLDPRPVSSSALLFHPRPLSMYGQNYGNPHHRSSSSASRGYQSQSPHPGQIGHSYSSGPHNADPQLWQWFTAVDTDRSGSISVAELQAALVNG
jgi:hypothetical protein